MSNTTASVVNLSAIRTARAAAQAAEYLPEPPPYQPSQVCGALLAAILFQMDPAARAKVRVRLGDMAEDPGFTQSFKAATRHAERVVADLDES